MYPKKQCNPSGGVQVADRLEASVTHVLDQGYRTGDIMSDGAKQIGCSAVGDVIEEYLHGL